MNFGDERIRTDGLMRAKHAFYQLNYIPDEISTTLRAIPARGPDNPPGGVCGGGGGGGGGHGPAGGWWSRSRTIWQPCSRLMELLTPLKRGLVITAWLISRGDSTEKMGFEPMVQKKHVR